MNHLTNSCLVPLGDLLPNSQRCPLAEVRFNTGYSPNPIVVPYGWSRITSECGHQRSVYYVSPMAQAFFSENEVAAYFADENNCQCFLENVLSLPFEQVFNFEPTRGYYQMSSPNEFDGGIFSPSYDTHIDWCIRTPANEIQSKIQAAFEKFRDDSFADPYDFHLSLADKKLQRQNNFKKWIGKINHEDFFFTHHFGVVSKLVTPTQQKHLAMRFIDMSMDEENENDSDYEDDEEGDDDADDKMICQN